MKQLFIFIALGVIAAVGYHALKPQKSHEQSVVLLRTLRSFAETHVGSPAKQFLLQDIKTPNVSMTDELTERLHRLRSVATAAAAISGTNSTVEDVARIEELITELRHRTTTAQAGLIARLFNALFPSTESDAVICPK